MIEQGTILNGKYEILEQIGSGGMAEVYKARRRAQGGYVAVKILKREYNEDEAFVRKFVAEAKSTSGLSHPNIVNICDAGHEKGIHYIVMELVEGITLKRYIRRYGRLSARETVDFAIQIASGIEAAHEHHIIHRDIKPQNILVSDNGKLKVTDFGIAKAATGDTLSLNTMGSVHYLSPEQARGGYSDERGDIYSLGITIYEMATGRVPFDGDNTVAIALKHLKEEMTPPRCFFPDIPASLENIILKCTRKSPEERYQSAADLIADLKKVFLCPDGNYVFDGPDIDETPTRTRTPEELAEIRKRLREGDGGEAGETPDEENDISGQTEEPTEEEEEEDGDDVNPALEKTILIATVVIGLLLGFGIFYFVSSSMHLIHWPWQSQSTEAETQTGAEATTEEKTAETTMPSVLELTMEEAETEMRIASLVPEFIYEPGSEEGDAGLVVVDQEYRQGEKLPSGSTVQLTLGADKDSTTQEDRIEVPSLVNNTEDEAVEKLEELGLKAKKVYANSDTVKEGYIIKQNPKAGTTVDLGFTITITVSKGVSQVRVPSLYGMSQEEAEKELNNAGLTLGNVNSDYSGSVGVGDVIGQGIESGTMVDKGTAVSIIISLGEQESYHYEGTVSIEESPFTEESPSGRIELVLVQNGSEDTVYAKSDMDSDDFPLTVTFEGEAEGDAVVEMYVSGEKYADYSVTLHAVAD